ncbi:MAG: replication restart helicase PriA [Spirochaetota bacterium]
MLRLFVEQAGHTAIVTAHSEFDATQWLGHRCRLHDGAEKKTAVLLSQSEGSADSRLQVTEADLTKSHKVLNAAALELAERVAEQYFAGLDEVIAQSLPPMLARLPGGSTKKKSGKAAAGNEDQPDLVNKASQPAPELPALNEKQQSVADAILSRPSIEAPEHLIWGVTGSGKTRIYEYLIAQTLARGEQALLLVPEIALSGQIMDVIRRRFGERSVLYHSSLNDSERFAGQQAFLSGAAGIAVGTRSAVFLPAAKLGLIIIDEEHDGSFKDQRALRFDTRVVARLRQECEMPIPRLVLGSATPSLESLMRAKDGRAQLYRLRERATGQSLPKVFIPDYHAQHGLISPFLMEKMHEHLSEKNQVLLLMNRRGHSTHVHCPVCDGYAECPRCAVSLTFHKDNTLRCHHCGYSEAFARFCPKDGELRRLSGRGIQKVEDILEAQFGAYSYARLDRDTTRQKNFASEVLQGLRERQIDILLGTQMIAKGFDIEGVTLVGVLSIDPVLNSPDYRASEQAWQLLAQVVGRSGRHRPGEVVIQTMEPQHPAVLAAAQHNADTFYAAEAELRRMTHYPPFGALARLLLRSDNEQELFTFADRLAREIRPQNTRELFADATQESVEILGPASPGRHKLENEFRVHFLLKAPSEKTLHAYLKRIVPLCERMVRLAGTVSLVLDIDPRETN